MIWLLIFLLNLCKDAPSRNSGSWLWTWKNESIATCIAGVCWKTKYIARWHHCNRRITVWEPFCLMGLKFGKTDLTRPIWWDWLFFLFFDDERADVCRPCGNKNEFMCFCAVGNLESSLLNQSSQSQSTSVLTPFLAYCARWRRATWPLCFWPCILRAGSRIFQHWLRRSSTTTRTTFYPSQSRATFAGRRCFNWRCEVDSTWEGSYRIC